MTMLLSVQYRYSSIQIEYDTALEVSIQDYNHAAPEATQTIYIILYTLPSNLEKNNSYKQLQSNKLRNVFKFILFRFSPDTQLAYPDSSIGCVREQ